MNSFVNSLKGLFLSGSNTLTFVGLASAASFVWLSKLFYFDGGRCTSRRRLDDKTVIVTGANTGIGYETALELAKRGARVILACRDSHRANAAAEKIRAESGNGNVVVELVDLASLDSVREFCKRVNSNERNIDILINNAGNFN
jgi:NADPH:quinone reductase-like Zn-dependent oxidoreductase